MYVARRDKCVPDGGSPIVITRFGCRLLADGPDEVVLISMESLILAQDERWRRA